MRRRPQRLWLRPSRPRLMKQGSLAGRTAERQMAERTQAEKPNSFNVRWSGRLAWAKMAEHPNWDNSNDFNTPRGRRQAATAFAAAKRAKTNEAENGLGRRTARRQNGRTNPSRKT